MATRPGAGSGTEEDQNKTLLQVPGCRSLRTSSTSGPSASNVTVTVFPRPGAGARSLAVQGWPVTVTVSFDKFHSLALASGQSLPVASPPGTALQAVSCRHESASNDTVTSNDILSHWHAPPRGSSPRPVTTQSIWCACQGLQVPVRLLRGLCWPLASSSPHAALPSNPAG